MAVNTTKEVLEMGAIDNTGPAIRSAEQNIQRLRSGIDALKGALGAIGITVGAGTLVAIGRQALQAAGEYEQALARVNATLRATGNQFGITRGQLVEMADALSASTRFDDTAIINAGVQLLKFGNIHGKVFQDALKLSTDLALLMGSDVPEAAAMIGKSLQSPTEGLMMMERQFGKLEEAEEKHIKTLASQGRALEAQNAVLDLYRAKIGEVNAELRGGLSEASTEVGKAWDDMLKSMARTETVGGAAKNVLSDIAGILREIERLAKGPGPLQGFENSLTLIEQEIQRIERGRSATRRSPLIDEQLARLKAERDNLRQMMEAARSTAVDPFGFDPKSIDLRLGGNTKDKEAESARKRAIEEEARRRKQLLDEDVRNWVRRIDELESEWMKVTYGWERQEQFLADAADNLTDITKRVSLTAEEQERLNRLLEQTRAAWRDIDNMIGSAVDDAKDLGDQLQTRIIVPTGDEAQVRGLESYDERSDARIRAQMEWRMETMRESERAADLFEHAVQTGIMVGMRRGGADMATELRRLFTDAILASVAGSVARQIMQGVQTGNLSGFGGTASFGFGLTEGAWRTPVTWQEDAAGNAWQSGGQYNWGGIAATGLMFAGALDQYRNAGRTGDPAGAKRSAGLTAAGAAIGTYFMPGVGTVIGGMAGGLLGGLLGGDGDAMRTAGFSQGFGQAAGWGASVNTQRWFDPTVAAGVGQLSEAIAQQEQNLIHNLSLSADQIEAVNQALRGLESRRYEFGMEHTDWTASGAAQSISADRISAIATALGRSMEELTSVMQLSAEQWEAAIEQLRTAEEQAEMSLRGFANSLPEALGITQLESFQRSLAVSPTLSPLDQLAGARAQYEDFLSRAMGGEREAIFGFPDVAQQLLGIGREAYASGPEFQDLFREVNTSLNQVLDRQREEQVELMSGLTFSIKELQVSWLEELRITKKDLVQAMNDVQTELKRMQAK